MTPISGAGDGRPRSWRRRSPTRGVDPVEFLICFIAFAFIIGLMYPATVNGRPGPDWPAYAVAIAITAAASLLAILAAPRELRRLATCIWLPLLAVVVLASGAIYWKHWNDYQTFRGGIDARLKLQMVGRAIELYREENSGMPVSLLILVSADYFAGDMLLVPTTGTSLGDIAVGGLTLADLDAGRITRTQFADAVHASPPVGAWERVGDFLFCREAAAWTIPHSDVVVGVGPGGIFTDGHRSVLYNDNQVEVQAITSTWLAEQNAFRASYGLAPLPISPP